MSRSQLPHEASPPVPGRPAAIARALTPQSRWLLAVAILAVGLRVCNLGCFSLWLDEVFQVDRARGPMTEVWFSTGLDDHPPLSALVMSVGYRLGLGDNLQRLVPVTLGVLSIVLLATWARRRFGTLVAAAVAGLAALSPFHVRYSQELRPYPYLLFLVALTLVVVDRTVASRRWGWVVPCGLVLAAGLYSHSLFPLVAAPVVAAVVGLDRKARRAALAKLGVAAVTAAALFAPWLPNLLRIARADEVPNAQAWTVRELSRRWQFLTVGGWEGADLSWSGGLMAVLALIGVGQALRRARRGGLEVVVGALVGLVGVELLFHFVWQRWSVGRYSVVGWPFLVVVIALGFEWIVRLKPRALGIVTALALVVGHANGLLDYSQRGREHWDLMAATIRELRRPGEPILTENLFCQLPLEYYLRRSEEAGADIDEGVEPLPLNRKLERLVELWPEGGSCLLVRGGTPHSAVIRRVASHGVLLASFSQSQWLYRLPPRATVSVARDGVVTAEPRDPARRWPDPILVLPSAGLDEAPATWVGRLLPQRRRPRPTSARLELDRDCASVHLLSGWSGPETSSAGETFAWAVGMEAGVLLPDVEPAPLVVEARLWPFQPPGRTQWLRALVNGHEIGRAELGRGPQILKASVAAGMLRPDRNLLVLQFAYALPPASLDPLSRDRRSLACAVDWIDLRTVAR